MIGRVVTAVLVRAGRLADLLIDCWPAPEVTRARVLAKFADDVPAAGVAAGTGPGAVGAEPLAAPAPGQPTDLATGDWTDVRGGRPEPTEELLLAAANMADDYRRHTHFNHPRHEYLGDLSRKLRSRAVLFARSR